MFNTASVIKAKTISSYGQNSFHILEYLLRVYNIDVKTGFMKITQEHG